MKGHRPRSQSTDLSTVGITLPVDFPRLPYEAIHEYCQPKMKPNPPLPMNWEQYAAAWNAIAYRFLAVTDHDQAFASAITKHSNFDRYLQERELFNFFVAGLSTIETFLYGIYFLASIASPSDFPVSDPRSITLKTTSQKFTNTFPNEAITSRLEALTKNSDFVEWCDVRNILAHRCAPGRIIHRVLSPATNPPNDIWKLYNIPLSSDTTGLKRKWLSQTLTELLDDALIFVQQQV